MEEDINGFENETFSYEMVVELLPLIIGAILMN